MAFTIKVNKALNYVTILHEISGNIKGISGFYSLSCRKSSSVKSRESSCVCGLRSLLATTDKDTRVTLLYSAYHGTIYVYRYMWFFSLNYCLKIIIFSKVVNVDNRQPQ